MRGCHSPGIGRITAPGSSSPQSTQRAAEAAADFERRLDDGVAREARRDRFEIREAGGGGPSRSSSSSQGAGRKVPLF